MSPFIVLLQAIRKLLSFKVDRDEFKEAVRETKKYIEGVKRDIEDIIEEVEGNIVQSDNEIIADLIETDMLPAVYNTEGKILTDENGKIVLRY